MVYLVYVLFIVAVITSIYIKITHHHEENFCFLRTIRNCFRYIYTTTISTNIYSIARYPVVKAFHSNASCSLSKLCLPVCQNCSLHNYTSIFFVPYARFYYVNVIPRIYFIIPDCLLERIMSRQHESRQVTHFPFFPSGVMNHFQRQSKLYTHTSINCHGQFGVPSITIRDFESRFFQLIFKRKHTVRSNTLSY